MFHGNKERGFTLLEFIFAAVLVAALPVAGLFAVGRQSKTEALWKNMSEMDHVAYSILSIISDEIKNSGSSGEFQSPIYFVDGGERIDPDGEKCDSQSAKQNGPDCITFESSSYERNRRIKKSFFVENGVLKMRNSDSSKTQSLTSDNGKIGVEDFQIGFLMGGGDGFQGSMDGGEAVEAVKVTITLKSGKNPSEPYEIKSYSVVANPRNI